jgi:hypothetical protein
MLKVDSSKLIVDSSEFGVEGMSKQSGVVAKRNSDPLIYLLRNPQSGIGI